MIIHSSQVGDIATIEFEKISAELGLKIDLLRKDKERLQQIMETLAQQEEASKKEKEKLLELLKEEEKKWSASEQQFYAK